MGFQNPPCSHPMITKLMCTTCGQKVDSDHGFDFGYLMEGLELEEHADDQLRQTETNKLLSQEKLVLVLDLDETLINSTNVQNLRRGEIYLQDQDQIDILKSSPYIVKLRPFVRQFLMEASTMFEMYLYTLGTRAYAKEILNFLDPEKKFFNSRLIAREDSTRPDQKDLDVVLAQERAVVVVDDKKEVWPKHEGNLVPIQKYIYFASRGIDDSALAHKPMSLAELKIDEPKVVLAAYLRALKAIHKQFFYRKVEASIETRDVREVMKMVRGEVLKGCKILMRHVLEPRRKCFLKMAEKMGAICVEEFDDSVTHVVSEKAGPEELQWLQEKKIDFLVFPDWIRRSYMVWKRKHEKYFAVKTVVMYQQSSSYQI